MTKRLQKTLGVLLVALLALCAFALPALAYEVHADGTITFEDNSYPTGYKIGFDMPEGVTFEGSGGVWADWIRDAYEVPNLAATATGGIDYYCWADKYSAFSFNIPDGYILEDAQIVPATAGEFFEVDSYGFVMLKLNAPATLKLTLGQVTYNHTYTDLNTGVSITLSSVEAKKVEGATFFSRLVDDFDEVGYVQSAVMKAINELPASEQYSPTGLYAYDTTFSEDYPPTFYTAYIAWNQYPFYVSIPLPAGWNTTDIHAYHYWAEPGGGEYAQAVEREFTISADGKSVVIKEDMGAYYGRYCLVFSGEVAPAHDPGWAYENGGYYFYEDDGTLRTDAFVPVAGKYYYLGKDGKLVTGGWIEYAGKSYYIDSDWSLALNRFVKYGNKYYYFGADAQLVTGGWIKYAGKSYYIDSDWSLALNRVVSYGGKYYYFGADAQLVTDKWVGAGNDWYYFKPDGSLALNEWVTYQGYNCHFNAKGICDNVRAA